MKLFPHQYVVLNDTKQYNLMKPIPGYENYLVDPDGNVYSKKTHKILKGTEHNGKQPYFYVSLRKNGKTKKIFIHRLVAMTFLDNPNDKEQVNHIDGDVQNNVVCNLEWCTNAENTQHAYDTFLNQEKQLHITYDGETHSLRKWCSLLGIDYKKTWNRYRTLGWSIERCFMEGGDVICQR